MNLQIQGSRPPSARSRSRVNPITGEEIPDHTPRQSNVQNIAVIPRPASRPNSRPQDVPPLTLGGLALGGDKDPDRMIQLDPYGYKLDTPKSANTSVSWGTPTSVSSVLRQKEIQLQMLLDQQASKQASARKREEKSVQNPASQRQNHSERSSRGPLQNKLKQPSAWDKDPVPENLPPPSERHKQQYAQYKEEMQQSYRQKNLEMDENSIREKIEQLKLEIPVCDLVEEQDEEGDQTQKCWTQQPYSKKAQLRRQDVEELEEENKKKKLVETVMIDQLSRFVVCDPEQNEILSKKAASHAAPMKKGSYRKMHDSKLQTSGSSTENLLAKKVHFGARILSRNSRDTVRELTGFFFALDSSITIYEFRQFGKSAKALPFIKRGVYKILNGRRKNEFFSIADIMQGSTLSFSTASQPLPDSMMSNTVVHFRIIDVDDNAKAKILLHDVVPGEREEVWKRVHLPLTEDEMSDRLLINSVQALVRSQIKNRGVKAYTGLLRRFSKMQDQDNGKINRYELEKGLIDYRIDVPQEKFEDLWELLDAEGTSFLEYDVFMRGFLGEMTEKRKKLIRKAFMKMDTNKQGVIDIGTMGRFYNAHKHPKVRTREMREDEARAQFVLSFQESQSQGEVSYAEFEAYYEGLSVGVDRDEDFENIVKNAWGV